MPRPIVLDMVLCGGDLKVWSDRSGMVHITTAFDDEIVLTPGAWEQLVVAIRVGDWERRS